MGDFVVDGQPFEMPEAAAEQDYANTPSSFGSFLGASVQSGPVMELERAQQRGTQEGSSWFDQWLNTTGQTEAGLPVAPQQQTPTISAEDANKRFAPPGSKITDSPLPEGLARIMGQQKTDEINRNSVLTRFSQAHSGLTDFGAGTIGFMLDPINASTSFLPGIGEETMLTGLGRIGLDTTGILARTGARLAAGGLSGGVAQAPLVALQLGLSQESDADYGLRDAARDMMFGAAAGAIFHAGFGAIGDAYRAARGLPAVRAPDIAGTDADAIVNADATTKADAMKSAISQMVSGREIDVTPVFDVNAANKARAELSSWYDQQARLAAETDAALQAADKGTASTEALTTKFQAISDQLEQMRSQHAGFLADIENAQGRLADTVDTQTPQRIAAIDDELSQDNLPAARRDELQAERSMLTEGAATTPEGEALEKARTEAEITGLQEGAKRVAGQIASMEKRAGPLQEKATVAGNQTESALKLQADRIESRERLVSALTARSIRRYAGHLGVALEPGEDAAMASRIINGGKQEIDKVLEEVRSKAHIAPPVPEGHVRFFHGGLDPTSGGSRWATPDAEYARNFRNEGRLKNVSYVDIPKGDQTEIAARQWDEIDEASKSTRVGDYGHVELPEAWAKKLKPYSFAPAAEARTGDAALLAEANDRFGANAQDVIARTAQAQQDLYRNGYAPGIPQAEFNAVNEEVYGRKLPEAGETGAPKAGTAEAAAQRPVEGNERPAESGEAQPEGAPGAGGEPEEKIDPQLAAAMQHLDVLGPLSAADRAEIQTALQAVRDANLYEQAYQQAGECLLGAFA